MSKCPFCGQPIYMQSFCVNWRSCPSFRGQYKKMQKVLPSTSDTASQHPKGKETGQQPSTARELKKKIAQSYRKIAPRARRSATGQLKLQNQAGSGQDPLPDNAKRLKNVSKAQNEATTQKKVIVKNKSGKSERSMQLVVAKSKKDKDGRIWTNYKIPKSRGTSASGSVAQNPSLQQPVAGPSSAVTPVQPSKQILKVNKASKDSTRQNLERSGEAKKQASANQGEDRNLHQTKQVQAIGPVGNFDKVTQAQSAPVAAASSTSSYSLLGPIQNPPLGVGVPQYFIVCNPQAAATNQPNPPLNLGSSAARAIQPAPNPQQIGQNEASTSHGTSASGSEVRNPSVQQLVAGPSSAVTHPVQPSKQILKVNEASRDARQNLERSDKAKKQASASQRSSQGEDRNLHQRIGPVGNFGNVAQAQSAPVAAASSTSSYSLLGPIQNSLLDVGVPQYYIVCNPQAAATNQPNPQQNPGYSAARAIQPAPNPQQIGQNEASTSHGTSASGSEVRNPSVQQLVAGPSSAVTHPVQPSKQILKVNEASRDARQNLERSDKAKKQASASQRSSQGEDRNLHQRIGPVGNFDRVTQAQSAPVAAAASTSSYSLLGPIQNSLLDVGVPQYYIVCNPQAAATNQPNPQQNPGYSAARAIQPAPNPQQIGQNEASTSHGTSASGSVVRDPSVQQPVAGPSSAVTHSAQSRKQILKVNKTSKDSTRQIFGRSGEAEKQASASQGEDRNLHQRMQTLAIGPVGTSGNVVHSRLTSTPPLLPWPCQNTLADMSIPQYYDFCKPQATATNQPNSPQKLGYLAVKAMQPAPNPQHVGQNEASTSHGTSASAPAVSPMHTDDDASGFCLMCEMFVHNVDQHWRDWHGQNDCYKNGEYKSKRMLLCNGTDLEKELYECTSCLKVLFKHRFINHHCPVLENFLGRSLDREKPNRQWGYCLMCKFNFEDLIHHRAVLHEDKDNVYSTRMIFGQWTLLPNKTLKQIELTLCASCRMPIYKYQDGIHLCV